MPADLRSDDKQLVALVDRLDDKELICFSCYALVLYFDPMSRMAVWKQRLGGARFGSADQAEYWAGISCKHCNAMSSEILAGLGSKALGTKVLAREALARIPLVRKVLTRERDAGQRNTGRGGIRLGAVGLENAGHEGCWVRRRRSQRQWQLSKSKSRNTTGVRQVLLV